MKQTSATKNLRYGEHVNKPVQDGVTYDLLCFNCEQTFARWEDKFAAKAFHTADKNPQIEIPYSDWMAKFCASIAWRVARYLQLRAVEFAHMRPDQQACVDSALQTWREFMLGEREDVGVHSFVLVPPNLYQQWSPTPRPPNLQRFLRRVTELDIAANSEGVFTYAKIGPFVLVGLVAMDHPEQWESARIDLKGGVVGGKTISLPSTFEQYLLDRCAHMELLQNKMSPGQIEKINERFRANMAGAAASGYFAALKADVEAAGDLAFYPDRIAPEAN
jgi:hypothetical protein